MSIFLYFEHLIYRKFINRNTKNVMWSQLAYPYLYSYDTNKRQQLRCILLTHCLILAKHSKHRLQCTNTQARYNSMHYISHIYQRTTNNCIYSKPVHILYTCSPFDCSLQQLYMNINEYSKVSNESEITVKFTVKILKQKFFKKNNF